METVNAEPKSKDQDPVWVFLAEQPLSETIVARDDGNLAIGTLFQAIRDLGVPPECLNKIEMTLMEFDKKTMAQLYHGEIELPFVVRLFCQKKMIEAGNIFRSEGDHREKHAVEPIQMIHPANPKGTGGWGFFLVERAREIRADSSVGPSNLIDLFLYREGEQSGGFT